MTEAARAREAAFSIEGKKDGLYQKKGEDWVVRFTIQASELCDQLRNAPLGTRYQLALVEVADDGQPVNRKGVVPHQSSGETTRLDKTPPQPSPVSTASEGAGVEKRKSPAQIAGYLCTLPSFHEFLRQKHPVEWAAAIRVRHANGTSMAGALVAAAVVRMLCNVNSRSYITEDNAEWSALRLAFMLWEKEAEIIPA